MERPSLHDRRTQATRRAIVQAFFALLRERGFARVSVTGICARANINRGTFYLHYEDKYALLDDVIDQALDEEPPFVAGQPLSLCQRPPANDDYRLLYEDAELFPRVCDHVLRRGEPLVVPQIVSSTGCTEEDARILFVMLASGNLAVNRMLGWQRDTTYDHVQELLRAAGDAVLGTGAGQARP